MQIENAIEVHDIKKSFKIYMDKGKTLKDRLAFVGKSGYQEREVLKGISFNVKKGEAVGLIGKNGCGKSTTLKMLTRIIYPDSGSIEIKGKVSSLLELGAGFHPDMSGRENIYLNASIFGLTKKEIDKKVDDIIAFSELEEFIENPVRTYSSGMYMRLAFSVAINVDAEVLLIDEILGVGDVSFQRKCFERLKEIKADGATIVIVSHSLEQIEQICDRSIWILDGKIEEEGNPRVVNAHYFQYMENRRMEKIEREQMKSAVKTEEIQIISQEKIQESGIKGEDDFNIEKEQQVNAISFGDRAVRIGNKKAEFVNLYILNQDNLEKNVFRTGDDIVIKCKMTSQIPDFPVCFAVSIWSDDDIYCYGTNINTETERVLVIDKSIEAGLILKNTKLMSGKYWINIGVYSKDAEVYDEVRYAKPIYIHSDFDNREYGLYQMEHIWLV